MARRPRYDHPGAWHHVTQRGSRRGDIVHRDSDCLLFLRCLEETVQRFGIELHAYALIPNHFHLLVRTPLGNLSRSMRYLEATYVQRLNLRYRWDGPLFKGRFGSQPLVGSHLDHVFAYVHLNPHRAGLATRLDDPCWTSLRAYLGKEGPYAWLRTDFFLDRLGGAGGITRVLRNLRSHRASWPEEMDLETGWFAPTASTNPPAPPARTSPAPGASAEQILARVARIAGASVEDLRRGRRGRGGNPARRLAVWALNRTGDRSHREIGLLLDMSAAQVGLVLWRLHQPRSPQFRAWQAALSQGDE